MRLLSVERQMLPRDQDIKSWRLEAQKKEEDLDILSILVVVVYIIVTLRAASNLHEEMEALRQKEREEASSGKD